MLVDGEKYACEACVRGHRVSNCQHNDRPLTHINKKGRPVSQCLHCRGLRKARASHVKCECGEKPHDKEDCAHTEKGDSKMDQYVCCCSHGARCSCALKKEHLDPVPEVDVSETPTIPAITDLRKPRLSTTHSDSSLTVFANGHHKPVHKHNDAAHRCGQPYKIPKPHTIHGHHQAAQKSVDSLPLTRVPDEASSQLQESITSAQQDVRLSRSEHGSPELRALPNTEQFNNQFLPLDLSFAFENIGNSPVAEEYNRQSSNEFDSYFATPEERPVLSAGFGMPSDQWTAFDLPLVDNAAISASYSQPPSYASFDQSNFGHPELTANSSSEEVSEVDDHRANGLPSPSITDDNIYSSAMPRQADRDSYRLSTTSSYLGLPQASFLASENVDSLDIDTIIQSVSSAAPDLKEYETPVMMDPETFARHGFTVQDAQKLAHPGVPTEAMGELSLPPTRDNADPFFAASFDEDNDEFSPETEVSTGLWSS